MNTGHVQGRNPHPSGWGGGQACNARALVLTEHRRPDGPALALQWCKHHFERHQRAMGAAGALVLVDNRHELYPPGTH